MAVELTQALLQTELHYNPLTGVFTRLTNRGGRPAGSVAGYTNKLGYVEINLVGNKCYAHRLAWLYVYGTFPLGQIDHINQNKTDNAIANLRDVDQTENNLNVGLRKHNTSGYRGVYWSKAHGLWTARIFYRKKTHSLGYFKEKEQAVARMHAERMRMGLCA